MSISAVLLNIKQRRCGNWLSNPKGATGRTAVFCTSAPAWLFIPGGHNLFIAPAAAAAGATFQFLQV